MFAHIHSPGTIRNLRRNPAIEINVVDPVVRKGYRFKGLGTVHIDGETYEQGLRILAQRGSTMPRVQIKAIVIVAIESAAPLISPAYDTGASEDEVAAVWRERVRSLRADQPQVDDRGR